MLCYEFRKLKRRYMFWGIIVLVLMPCLLQSYAGYLETRIPLEVLYITGLDLFETLIFPPMTGIVISMLFHFDEEHQGMLPLMLCGVSSKKYLWSKWMVSVFLCEAWFFVAYSVTFFFTMKRGGNMVMILTGQMPYLICSAVIIVLLVNLGFLVNLIFHNPLISSLTGAALTILGLVFRDRFTGRLNPYGYLNRFILIKEMEAGDFLCAGGFLLLSLLCILVMIKKEGRMGYAGEKK